MNAGPHQCGPAGARLLAAISLSLYRRSAAARTRIAQEASPSSVYGAALLMRLGSKAPPGFESRSLRA